MRLILVLTQVMSDAKESHDEFSVAPLEEKRSCKDESYTSQTVERRMSIGLGTMLLLEAPLASIHSAFMSPLALPGSVISNVESRLEGSVIRAPSHGILAWKGQCSGYEDSPFTYFKLCDSNPKPWDFCKITDRRPWRCTPVKPTLPDWIRMAHGIDIAALVDDLKALSLELISDENDRLSAFAESWLPFSHSSTAEQVVGG